MSAMQQIVNNRAGGQVTNTTENNTQPPQTQQRNNAWAQYLQDNMRRRAERLAMSQMTPGAGNTPDGFNAGPGGAFTRDVDADNELVENRLNRLLAGDSRYIQDARRRSAEAAESRGLLNSSIAAGQGERAAIQSALPIASQDANTYTTTGNANLQWLNQVQMNNRRAAATENAAATSAGATVASARIAAEDRSAAREWQSEQNSLDREFQRELTDLGYDWRANQAGLDRDLTREGWGFQAGQNQAQRDWLSGENALDRDLQWDMGRQQFRENTWMQHQGQTNVMDQLWVQGVANIDANPNLTDAQRVAAKESLANTISQIARPYQDPYWSTVTFPSFP